MLKWNNKDEFLEKMFRRSHSEHSRRFYKNGIDNFHAFCDTKKIKEINRKSVYKVLDSYAAWLDGKGIKPKTIVDYVSAVRKFLGYLDIRIDPTTFKSKVTMPRVYKIADEALKLEDVRTILSKGRPNKRTRALILLLLSTGMRIGEALNLKVGDLDLSSKPASVRIRAEYVKTGAARVVYMSDEARDAIREIVSGSPAKERLVFDYSGDLWQREKVVVRTFRQVVERAGLGEKIENHRIHKIHFHSFRKFFLTKGSDIIGEHAAHALCGHGFYMDTYYKKSEDERKADYLKLMPHLTVWKSHELTSKEVIATFNKQFLSMAGYSKSELEDLGDLSRLSPQEVQQLVRQKSKSTTADRSGGNTDASNATMSSAGNGVAEMPRANATKVGIDSVPKNKEKKVPIGELDRYLEKGCHWVTTLPTNEVIISFPVDTIS